MTRLELTAWCAMEDAIGHVAGWRDGRRIAGCKECGARDGGHDDGCHVGRAEAALDAYHREHDAKLVSVIGALPTLPVTP